MWSLKSERLLAGEGYPETKMELEAKKEVLRVLFGIGVVGSLIIYAQSSKWTWMTTHEKMVRDFFMTMIILVMLGLVIVNA